MDPRHLDSPLSSTQTRRPHTVRFIQDSPNRIAGNARQNSADRHPTVIPHSHSWPGLFCEEDVTRIPCPWRVYDGRHRWWRCQNGRLLGRYHQAGVNTAFGPTENYVLFEMMCDLRSDEPPSHHTPRATGKQGSEGQEEGCGCGKEEGHPQEGGKSSGPSLPHAHSSRSLPLELGTIWR